MLDWEDDHLEFYAPGDETADMRRAREVMGVPIRFMKRAPVRWTAESSRGDSYGYGSLRAAAFLRDHPSFPHAIFSRERVSSQRT